MLNSPIDEIKNRLDILEVVGSYLKLQKTGANYRALCPFHSEKKPSFFVSPSRQMWHCFGGCQRGGDVFKFIMEIEGVEFGDALRILAQRAGVELKKERPELKTMRSRLYDVLELAVRFFEKQLGASPAGKEAKNYLLLRGINEESIKKWRLGYSPDTWQGLSDFLAGKGYQKEETERAGLALKNERGSFYDRFRGRIIFPIFDLNSQVIGFGGRVFKEKDKAQVAKYVNTPNTLLYDKSRVLYGLDKAKVEARKKDSCLLVEGYTDVIMSHQAGIFNVAATSGTALTPHQVKILKRYTDNLILGFDMDVAGDTATKRGIDLALSQGFNIKVLQLLEGKDPAEIISKNPGEWQKAIENSKSILNFYFETAFLGRNPESPEGKKEISKILLPVLKRIPNQIERSFWVQKLAGDLEVREGDVLEELKKVKLYEPYSEVAGSQLENNRRKSRKELLEERLLIMILKSPENIKLVEERALPYLSSQAQEAIAIFQANPDLDLKKVPAEFSDFLNYISLKSEVEEIEQKDILPEIQFCLREIANAQIKNKLEGISKGIKKAEEEKNLQKIKELSQEFNQLAKTLNNQ